MQHPGTVDAGSCTAASTSCRLENEASELAGSGLQVSGASELDDMTPAYRPFLIRQAPLRRERHTFAERAMERCATLCGLSIVRPGAAGTFISLINKIAMADRVVRHGS